MSWLQLVGGVESQTFEESPFKEIHIFAPVEENHDEDKPSYNPYLIAYHEDTNSFTYNDPWVQVDQASHSSSNNNEISLNINQFDAPNELAHESVPLETPIAQEQINCEAIESGTEQVTQHLEVVPSTSMEVAVEHVFEVSFPHAELAMRTFDQK